MNKINVTFVLPNEEEINVIGDVGSSILELAHKFEIDLEGACGGNLACATCHVVVDDDSYKKLPTPQDQEEDMLDLAFGVEKTSRLGCQIILSEDLDGIRIKIPQYSRNI